MWIKGYDDWKTQGPPEASYSERLVRATEDLESILDNEQHNFGGDTTDPDISPMWREFVGREALLVASASDVEPDDLLENVYDTWVK